MVVSKILRFFVANEFSWKELWLIHRDHGHPEQYCQYWVFPFEPRSYQKAIFAASGHVERIEFSPPLIETILLSPSI